MKKKTFKKILLTGGAVLMLLCITLAVHIYLVTRPKPVNEKTVFMARVDFHQDISQEDASKITAWLYRQQGVDHVLCNPESDIAVFTYRPARADADDIAQRLTADLHYNGQRFLPSKEQLKTGCPVAVNSFAYKLVKYFKNI